MRGIRLEDLPDRLRRQVEDKIRSEDVKRVRIAPEAPELTGGPKTRADASGRDAGPVDVKRRAPNKTESEYNRLYLSGAGLYEAVTLHLPGGSRYTPDWMTVASDRVTLHEVKGGYRLGSHGRALTAFREAVAAFPCFSFVWAVRKAPGEWDVRNHQGGQHA